MSQRKEGANACWQFFSINTMRCSGCTRRRSSLAATIPPTPPPRITIVFTVIFIPASWELERRHGVAFLGPLSKVDHASHLNSFDEFLLAKAPGRATGSSSFDLDALGDQLAQHVCGVVVSRWGLLAAFGSAYAICEQEKVYRHLVYKQSGGVAERIVSFLASVGCVLKNDGQRVQVGLPPSFSCSSRLSRMRASIFHFPENRAFPPHLLEQDFPDQIKRIKNLGICQPVVHDIPVLAGPKHSPVFHHIQVLRKVAEGNPEPVGHVRNGHLLITERVQDLQAQRMRKNLAHFRVPGIDLGLWVHRAWIVFRHGLKLRYSIEL